MVFSHDVTQLIGNTPLLHLRQASEATGCTILGKAEFLNPGGSVKDRTALGIIRAAEAAGELQPGGVIVLTIKNDLWEGGFSARIDTLEQQGKLTLVEEAGPYVSMPGEDGTIASRAIVLGMNS